MWKKPADPSFRSVNEKQRSHAGLGAWIAGLTESTYGSSDSSSPKERDRFAPMAWACSVVRMRWSVDVGSVRAQDEK